VQRTIWLIGAPDAPGTEWAFSTEDQALSYIRECAEINWKQNVEVAAEYMRHPWDEAAAREHAAQMFGSDMTVVIESSIQAARSIWESKSEEANYLLTQSLPEWIARRLGSLPEPREVTLFLTSPRPVFIGDQIRPVTEDEVQA
jgi:hypothetical protein